MKIYTKTGDKGQTSLFGGKRISKDSSRIKAYGNIDELNAVLGICLSSKSNSEIKKILKKIQHQLFIAGADLATPNQLNAPNQQKTVRLQPEATIKIEKLIDRLQTKLPVLTNFILPGGSSLAAFLHLARTVCRRAEREITALQKEEKINRELLPFLNRLSDLLFVLARYANKSAKIKEEKWSK